MDAATLERRRRAIERLQLVAVQMREVNQRMAECAAAIALGNLAQATRTAWARSLCALEQASAGSLPTRLIDEIATPESGCDTPHLRALRLSTLKAAERRLQPVIADAFPNRVSP